MSFLLAKVLSDPGGVALLNTRQYEQLVRQARSSNLLPALADRLQDAALMTVIPPAVVRHLLSALVVQAKQQRDLAYNIKLLLRALAEVDQKLVLLKGAAYIQSGMLAGRGRLISDIDIIVPRQHIEAAEQSLNRHGWVSGKLDPYNERYYRRWMHEIPPLGHEKHGSTLDLHFTILPPTASANIDARLLFERLQEVRPGVFTLCPEDMVIHSVTHLFHEGEFHNGLRDLWDLDRMLREFAENNGEFWAALVTRARALDLVGPLYYGLRYAQKMFGTPVPPATAKLTFSWPRSLRQPIMDWLFLRAFRPNQPESRRPFTSLTLYLLYIRSHYLRMPLYLLLPHLVRKTWMGRFARKKDAEVIDAPAKPDKPAAGEQS